MSHDMNVSSSHPIDSTGFLGGKKNEEPDILSFIPKKLTFDRSVNPQSLSSSHVLGFEEKVLGNFIFSPSLQEGPLESVHSRTRTLLSLLHSDDRIGGMPNIDTSLEALSSPQATRALAMLTQVKTALFFQEIVQDGILSDDKNVLARPSLQDQYHTFQNTLQEGVMPLIDALKNLFQNRGR